VQTTEPSFWIFGGKFSIAEEIWEKREPIGSFSFDETTLFPSPRRILYEKDINLWLSRTEESVCVKARHTIIRVRLVEWKNTS
jgi:hypothetical protein